MLITYRKAIISDIPFMTSMLLDSCIASGVFIEPDKLHEFPDAEIYIKGWPEEKEFGIIAETESGELVGATWIRNLPGLGHSVHEQLPEITIAVASQYRKKGIASELMSRLYETSVEYGVPKLSLGVHRDNLPAIKLYKKQGWGTDGNFQDYIMMSREVTNNKL